MGEVSFALTRRTLQQQPKPPAIPQSMLSVPGEASERRATARAAAAHAHLSRRSHPVAAIRVLGLSAPPHAPYMPSGTPMAITTQAGSGEPLARGEAARLGLALHADLTHVRIHADDEAANLARAASAQAFTIGSHVFFGEGEYRPDTAAGIRLLLHELAHIPEDAHTPVKIFRAPLVQPSTKPTLKFDPRWAIEDDKPPSRAQLLSWVRWKVQELGDEIDIVRAPAVKAQIGKWVLLSDQARPYLFGDGPVDDRAIGPLNNLYDQYEKLVAAIQEDKADQARDALDAEWRAADKAAQAAEALEPQMSDALRASFRKGTSKTIKDVVSAVKGVVSTGREIRKIVDAIRDDEQNILTYVPKAPVAWASGNVGTALRTIDKSTRMFNKLNRALSAFRAVLTILDRSKKATEAEQAMKDLSDVISLAGDLATATGVGLPMHFTRYTTVVIKPALETISKEIGLIIEQLGEENKAYVELTGDLMYPNAEPGGQKMFDFMIDAMRASDPTSMPVMPDEVKDYLYDHRDKLEAGTDADVPTEGSLWWKHLDVSAARRWLFANRSRIWKLFYGSMKVPERKHL